MCILRDRPDTEQELDDVKAEFRYQLRGEGDDLTDVTESFAYFTFDEQLTHDEMTDIFESSRSMAWRLRRGGSA